MKTMNDTLRALAAVLILAGGVALSGCDDSSSRPPSQAARQETPPKPKPPPTPEEAMGLETPGKLAAAVEGWIQSNEFGDYYRQSQDLISELRAKLVEDYRIRQESGLEENAFSRETRRKYDEAVAADKTLRAHLVECYSRKEVKPLPQIIAGRFTTAQEERGDARELLASAPADLEAFAAQLEHFRAELAAAGTADWAQDKSVEEWQASRKTLSDLSARANTAGAGISALGARLSSVVRRTHADEADALKDRADALKTDFDALTRRIAVQLTIVTGQVRLRTFADDCKALADGVRTVPELLERKRARGAEIRNLTSRIIASRQQGYADLKELAGQAEELKARSLRQGAEEQGIGKRVQGLAGGAPRLFGAAAVHQLKRDLPEPSAQARIDAELAALRMALGLQPKADPAGTFANLESKAWQIYDRTEEDALIKQMEETLKTVRRVAGRR